MAAILDINVIEFTIDRMPPPPPQGKMVTGTLWTYGCVMPMEAHLEVSPSPKMIIRRHNVGQWVTDVPDVYGHTA